MAVSQPLLPPSAPFPEEHINALNAVMANASGEQRHWLSGFLAGYHAAVGVPATGPIAAPSARPRIPLTILYGTESGNAEELADDARKLAAKQGFAPKLMDMADIAPTDLADHDHLLVIASTWGEGDPPERAVAFHDALMAADAPRLEGVRFAVLALGDSSYVNFCEVGRRIDDRLHALGAERIAERVECDLDYEAPAAAWTQGTLGALGQIAAPAPVPSVPAGEVIHIDFAPSLYTKTNPFPAEITESINLCGSRSTKRTVHLELALDGSGLVYEPGDALGIAPQNAPEMVAAVLEAVGLGGDAVLAEQLTTQRDITALSRQVIEGCAKINPDPALQALAAGDDWRGYLNGRQILDLFRDFPVALASEQLTGLLRKLPPRLYSVASSLKAYPDQAHLLVGLVDYQSHGLARQGVASGFVAERVRIGDRVPVYVKPNKNFRLPEDADRPVIMIGPGTGVAPFRAFVQERQVTGAAGKNWLFFGERNFTHDFLYQLEWQDWLRDGGLDRLDVAFSRDQPEKIYVQQRLWAQRRALYAWLEDGAHLYVCGDETAMAKDVHATLTRIVVDQSGGSVEAAERYLADLKQQKRYQRDVY